METEPPTKEAESPSEPQPEPQPEPQSEPLSEPQPEPQPEPQSEPLSEPQTEPEIEPETEPSPKSQTETPSTQIPEYSEALISDAEPRFTMIPNLQPPITIRPQRPPKRIPTSEDLIQSSEASETSTSSLPEPPPISDPQLEQFGRYIFQKVKDLHDQRFSLMPPYKYLAAWVLV
jgi:hypothetical protein